MKLSVSPRMVALLVLTSLSPLGAESPSTTTAPPVLNPAETSTLRSFKSPVKIRPGSEITATFELAVPIPRAIPVISGAPEAKPVTHLEIRRKPVSFHPITVKNGPQPYVIDPDSLQKGLALISELYRKSGSR